MLQFDKRWRFESPGPVPEGVMRAFSKLIAKIVGGRLDKKSILERFKFHFADVVGSNCSSSSSASWAEVHPDFGTGC